MKKKCSDDDDDDFVTIGTALAQYDEDEVPVRKPVSLQDQTVRDSKGRLRFHGAFTGGFSAGYFNTVDTEEGWTPTTFKSSRSQKAEGNVTQRPEDFMDDEDFSEFGIAPKKIATTKTFTDAKYDRKRKAELDQVDSSLIGRNILEDLVVPCRSSIGIRLLRKLGWREGQGIGPRERRRRRMPRDLPLADENNETETSQKVYGCSLPPGLSRTSEQQSDNGSSEGDDDGLDNVTFAPHDVCPIDFVPKGNVHGLGYCGLHPSAEILRVGQTVSLPVTSQKGKRGIQGQAFGVGAFEEDDDDIYGVESLSNYDMEIVEDDKIRHSTFGWTAPKHTTEKTLYEDLIQMKGVIEGFKRGSTSLAPKKIYPPPQIPRDFRPFHRFNSVPETKAKDSENVKLNAFSRGALLGEKPHLGSVFELVSTEDKAKMEAAKLQNSLKQMEMPQSLASSVTPPGDDLQKPPSPVSVKSTRNTESRPMSGNSAAFLPFARDPVKQKRYEAYLDATKNKKQYIQDESCNSHMTEWEKEREKEEFAKAALLFQPLSNMIASRFTRAKHDDDEQNVNLPADEEKSTQAKAAEMKMFGKLTRDRCAWHPDKMICRRFNIADPYPESNVVGLRTVKRDKCSIFNFLTFSNDDPQTSEEKEMEPNKELDSKPVKPLAILATVDLRPTSSSIRDDANEAVSIPSSTSTEKTEVISVDGNDVRPPIDLFKAIFEDTDSDSDSTDEKVVVTAPSTSLGNLSDSQKLSQETAASMEHVEPSVLPEMESIFTENIANEANEKLGMLENCLSDVNTSAPSISDDVFGPALPPSVTSPDEFISRKEVNRKRESNSSKHRHHHKVKHKHTKNESRSKKQKHKKKKKKQKKNTRETSSQSNGSDADYDTDVDSITEMDLKLLSKLKGYREAGKSSSAKCKK